MGPGRVTTTGEGSMYTVESAQRARHGSLQLLARGVGPQGPQGRGGQGLQQDISRCRRQGCNTEQGAGNSLSITLSLCPKALSRDTFALPNTLCAYSCHDPPTALPVARHGKAAPLQE